MAGKQLGVVHIRVNGGLLDSEPGASIDIGGAVRTPVLGDGRVIGYSESVKEAVIECVISVGQGTSLAALRDIAGAVATFECDTGQVYTVTNATLADPPKATAGEGGKVPIKLFGDPAIEMGV